MLKWMMQQRLNAYLEGTMKEYAQGLDSGRASRANRLQHLLTGITKNGNGDAVLQWHVPSQTDPNTVYECYVSIKPKGMSLFAAANNLRDLRSRVDALKNADVKCFCPCKDFRYSGAAYNMAHEDGFEEGHGDAGTNYAPDVRDPQRKHRLCKHLAAVFKGILTNAGTIMKDAREVKFPKDEPPRVDIGPLKKQPKKETPANNDKPDLFNKPEPEIPAGKKDVIPEGDKNIKRDENALPKMEGLNPIKTPEIQASLDALAESLGQEEPVGEIPAQGAGPVPAETEKEEKVENEVPEIPGLNPGQQNDNLMFDLEDAVNDPIFNPSDDED